MRDLLPIGTLLNAHGIRGALRLTCSPEHLEFLATLPTVRVLNRELTLRDMRGTPAKLIVEFEGVDDRGAAEELRGAKVLARRADLPEPAEDEYFLADFEGCEAVDTSGIRIGVVKSAVALPANAVLTVTLDAGGELLAPLTHDAVPTVDIAGQRVVFDTDFLGLES